MSKARPLNSGAAHGAGMVALVCLVLAVATVAIYWPVTGFDFVNYDDPDYVSQNPLVQAGFSKEGVAWAFSGTHSSNWHPLTTLSHMADCALFGLRPGAHHAVNLLLHAASAVLLLLFLRNVSGRLWPSALVAALFALHPLHVESVAWVSERKDVLSGFFFMLTLLAYSKHVATHRADIADEKSETEAGVTQRRKDAKTQGEAKAGPSRFTFPPAVAVAQAGHVPARRSRGAGGSPFYFLALLCFALGLMSKPMVVTVPFLLLLLDYWPLGRATLGAGQGGRWRALALEKVPFLLLAAASSAVTLAAQKAGGAVVSTTLMPLGQRLMNATVGYAAYVLKLVWPADLSVIYVQTGSWAVWQVAGAGSVIAAASYLVWRQARSRPYLLAGCGWFMGMLVPVIGLVQVGNQWIADRYTYLPAVGLFIGIAWSLADMERRRPKLKVPLALGCSAGLVACVLVTKTQISYWQNSQTLFRHAVAVDDRNFIAWNSLGLALAEAGQREEAEQCYRKALAINPNCDDANNNLGCLLTEAKRLDEAAKCYEAALRVSPRMLVARLGLGNVLLARGNLDGAAEQFSIALRDFPASPEAQNHLGLVLSRQGRMKEAVEHYRLGLKGTGGSAEALNNLAWILATSPDGAVRNGADAVAYARRACELTGHKVPVMLGTLAAAYAEAGRFEEAVAAANQARELALAAGEPEVAAKNQQLAELFSARKPYRDGP